MAETKNKKPFPVPFGPDGFITKRIKKQSTDTKTQKAKVEKQRQTQKKKTFVPGTLDTRPTTVYDRNNPGKKDNRPKYKSYQRPTESEKYKKPETKVTKPKEYRPLEAGKDYPRFDNVPSSTTTTPKVNDTTQVKQHKVSKDTEKDLNKAKDKGMSNARKAFKMAQGLLKRPTSR
jgi:hypothetical protein